MVGELVKYGSLEVTGPDGRRREFPIDLPSLIVGRAEGNGIVIDDLSISRRHARLLIESGRLLVEDLGSAQGTFVDGHIVEPNDVNLVEQGQSIRFGDVEVRYLAPVLVAAGDATTPESLALPGSAEENVEDEGPLSVIRLTLAGPYDAVIPGNAVVAKLTIHNRGRVVDEVHVEVMDLPAGWVELSADTFKLLPGSMEEVSITILPPRDPESLAGQFDFSVVVTSLDFQREAVAFGQLRIEPFEATELSLQPLRAKRDFTLVAENHGNSLANYKLSGADDESEFSYDFELPTLDLQPGQARKVRFRVRRPSQSLLGKSSVLPYKIVATPTHGDGEPITADGILALQPALEKFKKPAALVALLLIAAVAALAWKFGFDDNGGTATANAEAAYAGVHMCDKKDAANQPKPTAQPGGGSGTPLFAQNNPVWSSEEYAKAKDPEFGPDWCGTTIEQCGCAMTSVATVMALFNLLTMPDGSELSPKTVNDWFNKGATKTNKGWVSQGYVYGDVIWTSVNELSGEIAKARPGSPTIRFVRTGTGTEGEIRSELQAGRPIILEVPGHWIAAVGLDGDTILINDPYYPDRRTLDAYKGKVKSSVLFEQSNDLSGFVVTVPKSERVKITDKAGKVVGTLNTGTEQEVKESVQLGIEGAYYSTKDAWRDPTCVESPPRPGDGTTQIFLPGNRDDYKIEVLSPDGGPTSVAFHRYDKNGKSAFEVKDNSGPAVIAATFDPSNISSGGTNVVPGVTPTAEGGGSNPGGGGTAGGGAGTPNPNGTASTTTTPGGSPTTGSGSPTATRTPVTPTPVPPASVTVACQVQYSQTPTKNAAISCTATVTGNYTNTQWTVNGVSAPSAPNATSFATSFAADTVVTIGASACNFTLCTSGTQAVTVKFPAASPTATNTPTPTVNPSATPTPPPGNPPPLVNVVCQYVPDSVPVEVNCSTSFNEPFTSILWTATNGNPNSVTNSVKTFQTFRAATSGDVVVTAKVCYYNACTTSGPKVVSPPADAVPLQYDTQIIASASGDCSSTVTFDVEVLSSNGTPEGTVTYIYQANALFADTLVNGMASEQLYIDVGPGTYSYTVDYAGSAQHNPSTYSGTFTIPSCP